MQCASEQTERPDETYVKRRVQRALARDHLATEGTPATSAGDGDVRVSMEQRPRARRAAAGGAFETYGYGEHDCELSRARQRLWR